VSQKKKKISGGREEKKPTKCLCPMDLTGGKLTLQCVCVLSD
jgi:hypothetical protein